jgi:uncharacterized membrane protein (UPF0127 family)
LYYKLSLSLSLSLSLIEYVHLLGIRLPAGEKAPPVFFPLLLTLQQRGFSPHLSTAQLTVHKEGSMGFIDEINEVPHKIETKLCLEAVRQDQNGKALEAENTVARLEKRLFSFEKTDRAGTPPVTIRAEIAREEHEASAGLMYRRNLPDGEGMLFVFERDEILAFWMKDTFIPLSIAFITSDGGIIDIRDMEPRNLNPVESARPARYALEVSQGWFTRNGIREGDRIILGAPGKA